MSNDPNYRDLNPPPTPSEVRAMYGADDPRLEEALDDSKRREDWTWAERRAELYDMIERAGDWRNLSSSLRELGDRYDVSHTTIRNDIDAILEWEADHLGSDVEVELSMLQRSAVQDYLREARQKRKAGDYKKAAELKARAYKVASSHLSDLQSTGELDHAARKQEVALDAEVDSTTSFEVDDETRELALEVVRAQQQSDAGDRDEDDVDGGDEE